MVVIGWKSVRCSTFFITQRRKDMDKLLYSSSLSPPWQMRGWGYGQADGRWRRLFPEQDTIDDKDNASDADSSTPNHKPHLIPPLSQKRNPQTQIRRSKRRPRILPSRLLLWKKMTDIADQLALSHAEFEGIVIDSRILIEGYRPGQYMRIQLTHLAKFWSIL